MGDRKLDRFVAVAELEIRGLETRYRRFGLGAPLAASTVPGDPGRPVDDFVATVKVPVTALLRIDGARRGLAGGRPQARLDLYRRAETEWTENVGERVPLELEPTAALTATLEGAPVWQEELRAFTGSAVRGPRPVGLVSLTPYRPGLIPIVFVHGTASSAVRWARCATGSTLIRASASLPVLVLLVRLCEPDPVLRDADALGARRCRRAPGPGRPRPRAAPDGADRAQPGRPARQDAGDPERLAILGPHQSPPAGRDAAVPRDARGVSPGAVRRARAVRAARGVHLHAAPRELRGRAPDERHADPRAGELSRPRALGRRRARGEAGGAGRRAPRRARGELGGRQHAPRHLFIQTLQAIPVADEVAAHSIIPVAGDGPVETGDDDVVAYASAHVPGVESERVVRSGHSMQAHPETIAEVHRILLRHEAGP